MASDVITLAQKLARFSEHWSPRVVAEMNDYQFKVVKLQVEFVWHVHKDTVHAGEMFVLPKGVEHIG
jgi:mannose-6-phosphate isomerase-like protein (cupin superfamily)